MSDVGARGTEEFATEAQRTQRKPFGAAGVVARAVHIATIQCASLLRLSPRLPPGSLGPRGIARFGNHSFYLRAFQRYGPVFKVLWNRNLTICIFGFDRARRLLAPHIQSVARALRMT